MLAFEHSNEASSRAAEESESVFICRFGWFWSSALDVQEVKYHAA